ncbi:hypothetical protein G3H63_18925, partial [Microbacterium resistens]|nr:hypothetical protein [Microbacterium resistens]
MCTRIGTPGAIVLVLSLLCGLSGMHVLGLHGVGSHGPATAASAPTAHAPAPDHTSA